MISTIFKLPTYAIFVSCVNNTDCKRIKCGKIVIKTALLSLRKIYHLNQQIILLEPSYKDTTYLNAVQGLWSSKHRIRRT